MYKYLILTVLIGSMILPLLSQHCGSCSSGSSTKLTAMTESNNRTGRVISAPKRNHKINDSYYITYEWNKNPKIGTYILMVNVFDSNKKRVTDLELTADAYMPSMKGSHDTGDKPMRLNKKNQYAIPVYFMMLGDWEIEVKLAKNGKQIGNAFVTLDIK